MKLWVDDVRPASPGYRWVRSVNEAKDVIAEFEKYKSMNRLDSDAEIELIDLDHDAGDYADLGGDYIELLKWFEKNGAVYDIRLHSMNIVGRENMRAIIRANNWREVF